MSWFATTVDKMGLDLENVATSRLDTKFDKSVSSKEQLVNLWDLLHPEENGDADAGTNSTEDVP